MTAILLNMHADASSSTGAHPWIAPVAVVGGLLVVAVIIGTFLLRNRTPGGLANRKDAAVLNSTISNFTVHEQAFASTLPQPNQGTKAAEANNFYDAGVPQPKQGTAVEANNFYEAGVSYEVVADALMVAGTTLPHNMVDETKFGEDEDPAAATHRAGAVANETYQQVDVVDDCLTLSDEIQEHSRGTFFELNGGAPGHGALFGTGLCSFRCYLNSHRCWG
jgi:hypothetical protein